MMNLLELQTKDLRSMTKEELEQRMMLLLDEMHEIVDKEHDRIQKEKYAATNRTTHN
jgi:hypothetical protein